MHAGAAGRDGSLRVVSEDVARARTISQLRNRVGELHRPLELRMRHRTILIGVAARAIRPEGRELPGHHCGIGRVAAGAAEPRPVIHIGWRRVPVYHRGPGRSSMTHLARQDSEEMPGCLALGRCTVVAAHTRRGEAAVIDPRTRKGHRTLVTRLARRICDEVFRRFPGCGRAVMTAGAVRDESRVVHSGSGERGGAFVAVLASGIGGDVTWRLAGRGNAIVTGRAAADDAGVRFCAGCQRIRRDERGLCRKGRQFRRGGRRFT